MKLELRDYQRAAIDGLYDYWECGRGDNPLIVAPTGSGKSLMIAQLIKDACEFPGTRILLLTHVKELLEQNAEELLGFYPEADFGFYSASIGQKRLDKQITFAGIQSVWSKAFDMVPAPDLVLIDEAHLVPKNAETRYGKFLADLKTCNSDVKIVGMTATPYRLDGGWLHKGEGAIFDGIAYEIPVGKLMDEGYLSPVISKGGLRKIDLTNVHVRGGEFIESELAKAACEPELVKAVVDEVVTLGADRQSWLIFSSGVDHASALREEFERRGEPALVVTGDLDKTERRAAIKAHKSMSCRCLINVNVLTAGYNNKAVDLVALVRATMSTSLYVQMVGRGTRTHPGKENCLILDYGDNVARHGFIDAVKPRIKGEGGKSDAPPPAKECDNCQTLNPIAARRCIECDAEFPAPEANHADRAYDGAIMSNQVKAEWLDVDSVSYALWKKEGKPDSVRVTYECGMTRVSEWLCPDHGGYAASRYKARKAALGATAETTVEALGECSLWAWPGRIMVKPVGKFFEIVQLDYRPRAVDEKKVAEDERQRKLAAEMFGDGIPF